MQMSLFGGSKASIGSAGMSAGVPKHVVVNLRQLAAFKESEEVSLDTLKQKNVLNVSGKEARLPLKVGIIKQMTQT